jgi:cell wall-associated NlpC family hydrolase
MKLLPFIVFGLIVFSSCQGREKVVSSNKNDRLLNKYASIIGVPIIENKKLYVFIDSWYGTKYKYGGITKAGIDCSGFCNVLYSEVYNKPIKRTTADIAKEITKVKKSSLREGDFVFFNISKKKNAHVGIYLANNKFVHASSSKGVIISSLDNPYYIQTFNKGGRIK